MKKKIFTTMVVSGCLMLFAATAFASSDTATHGGMNVDNLLNSNVAVFQQTLNNNATTLTLNATKESAGGGEFWVEWFTKNGYQAFSSNYDHATKEHKATASSKSESKTSGWVAKKVTASAWVYSTFSGNTANWNTR